jgi:hypothetical protein
MGMCRVAVLLVAIVAVSCVTARSRAASPLYEGLKNEVGGACARVDHAMDPWQWMQKQMLFCKKTTHLSTCITLHRTFSLSDACMVDLGRRTQCFRELVTIKQLPGSVSVLEVPRHAHVLWGRRPLSEVGVGVSVCASKTADGGDAFNCTASVAVTAVNGVGVATVLSDCVVKPLVRISVPHEQFRGGELLTPPLAVRRLDSPPAAACLECTMGTSRVATCSDGVDNDGDQLVDSLDESCHASPWASESVDKASIAF